MYQLSRLALVATALTLAACSQGTAATSEGRSSAAFSAEQVASDYAVHGQIAPSDLSAIAAAGYKTVINNRPDGEEPGQPASAEIAAAAAQLGLAYHHIPVAHSGATDADAKALAAVLKTAKGPILAYCRSGRRAAKLKSLADELKQ